MSLWCWFRLHHWGLDPSGCHARCFGCNIVERTSEPGKIISEKQMFADHWTEGEIL